MRTIRRLCALLLGITTGEVTGLLLDRLPRHPMESAGALRLVLGEIVGILWAAAIWARRRNTNT